MSTKKILPTTEKVLDLFATNLAMLLDERKLSASELASTIGSSHMAIYRVLRREVMPKFDVAVRIAATLGVTVDGLLTEPKKK